MPRVTHEDPSIYGSHELTNHVLFIYMSANFQAEGDCCYQAFCLHRQSAYACSDSAPDYNLLRRYIILIALHRTH
jgi:hypothetical protein